MVFFVFFQGTAYDSPFNGENVRVERWLSEYRRNMESLLQRLRVIQILKMRVSSLCSFVGCGGEEENFREGTRAGDGNRTFFLMIK